MSVPSIIRSAKNKVFKFTPAQIKVREATSNAPHGPSQNVLIELAVLSFNNIILDQMLQILVKRISDDGKNWRHIFKSLIVFEFLCLHGNGRFLTFCKKHRQYFVTLKTFQYFERDCVDSGSVIRERATRLCHLLNDESALVKCRKETEGVGKTVKEAIDFEKTFLSNPRQTHSESCITGGSGPKYSKGNNLSISSSNFTPAQNAKPCMSDELKRALPADEDEEEAQLQIALAISKEEEDKKQLRRNEQDRRIQ
ncbi:hypothetical protein HZS_2583, partial [Henneguya salminicola]